MEWVRGLNIGFGDVVIGCVVKVKEMDDVFEWVSDVVFELVCDGM